MEQRGRQGSSSRGRNDQRSSRGGRGGGRGGGDRQRTWRPRVRKCTFCVEDTKIDYKDVSTLRRFVSDRAKIKSGRRTGTCARHQRQLARAIKRARHLALLPFAAEHVRDA